MLFLVALAPALIVLGTTLAAVAIATDHPGQLGSADFLTSFLGFAAGYTAAIKHYRSNLPGDRQEDCGPPKTTGPVDSVAQPSLESGPRMRRDGEELIIELRGAPV